MDSNLHPTAKEGVRKQLSDALLHAKLNHNSGSRDSFGNQSI